MKRKRAAGTTRTFSVSVDAATKRLLKTRADRLYGGNMSQLIAALGRDAEKRDAGERVIAWLGGPSLTEEDRAALDAELGLPALGPKGRKKKSAA